MTLSNKSIAPEEVLGIFKESEALLEGHFRLTSGRHSRQYMQCAKVLQYPHHAARLGEALAESFQGHNIDLVIGPAMGGILVAHEVGKALGTKALFTERENGEMKLRRGFELQPGQRVLVVEDVITTGGSVREVIEVVKAYGAEPVGVGVIVDRSCGKSEFGVPLAALLEIEIESFDPEACPLCAEGIPAIKPGSRAVPTGK
ncbi:orotate phosphoribosyltransferase [Desulfitobacterium dichloroeliminans LMG P-21439]|uniref:Orotate phosphoribosyltransferase n=1 Tax=Desulfitobacterium dichloroeliminans (strain LMG P-21439 / DCA1) TaxID=871963 RepID=L0FAY1_DESDL|nr:orotate phosphoribosyltransferase [Desulfitobacterium dichloroeliminans]AGA70175.1 orotate phosphoribosyltransferase [Desulfitobacterium dichloroeliminans LMG P-21439]